MEQELAEMQRKMEQEHAEMQIKMKLRQLEMEQEKERITMEAKIAELEAMEEIFSTYGSRLSRTKRYSSSLKDGMNQMSILKMLDWWSRQ